MNYPTLTDEELAEMEKPLAVLCPSNDVGWPYVTVVPRLIAELRASRSEVEHHEHLVSDLEGRLREADETLSTLANSAASATDMKRLHGKAEGVRLALSYLREYEGGRAL